MPFLARHLFVAAMLLGLAIAAPAQSLSADEATTRVAIVGDHLVLDLPVQTSEPTSAFVTAAVLFPDDRIVAQAVSPCVLASGVTHCHVTLSLLEYGPQRENFGMLPKLRLRYIVTAANTLTGTLSLNRIAPELYEFHVAGPNEVHPGATYTAQVRTVHPLTGAARGGVKLTASLSATMEGRENDLDLGNQRLVTNAQGFAIVQFTAPADDQLRTIHLSVSGMLANVKQLTSQNFNVPTHALLQLTTDKPLYQPGQTVHARLLLLDRKGHASAKKSVTLDVRDPDSTLVFRVKATTSRFGIASADWAVPSRLRLGQYSLSAETEGGPSGNAQVRISRYDLPTFAVTPKPDRGFYLSGENATVDVRANYLFGKPVLHGHVRVVREDERNWNYREQKYDTTEGKSVEGELDTQGSFLAHIDLSNDEQNFDANDPTNSFTDIHLAAYVTDASTNRTEQRRFDIRVTEQALHLYLIGKEAQTKGLPQRLYLAVTSADGNPAECDLSVSLLPHESPGEARKQSIARSVPLLRLHTNALGLVPIDLPVFKALQKMMPPPTVVVPWKDSSNEDPEIYVAAHDKLGRNGSLSESLNEPDSDIRLTVAKPLYRSGDPIDLTVESATLDEPRLPIDIQLIRTTQHGNLVLDSREVHLINGRAVVRFPTDERYTGYVFAVATALPSYSSSRIGRSRYNYYSSANGSVITASRALLFPRDNSLHVDVKMLADTYRPGDEATAKLVVRGPQNVDGDISGPAPSAIGLVAVDRAVTERNRTDSEFGNADNSSFFFRWYTPYNTRDVAGLTLPSLERLDMSKSLAPGVDLAATILLQPLNLEPSTRSSEDGENPENTFSSLLSGRLDATRKALQQHLRTEPDAPTTAAGLAALLAPKGINFLALRDPWDRPFEVVTTPESYGQINLFLRSDGPDKQPHTTDDFKLQLASWSWFGRNQRMLQNAVKAYHERTHGYIRDLTTLRDEMNDEHIDFDAWRDPWNQPFTYRFDIANTNYTIFVLSSGDPAVNHNEGVNSFNVGSAYIDYFTQQRMQLDKILNLYAAAHPYPTNEAELEAALQTGNLSLKDILDPWGHPLYATFRTRSFFTDSIRTEAHAAPGSASKTRTIITPITATSDTITFRSAGPDGAQGTADDFDLANLTHVRSQQSAKDASAKSPSNSIVRTGKTGSLEGTVTDPTGASIPGALITVVNAETNVSFEAKSGQDGTYLLDPLPTGRYSVRITMSGFMTLVYDQVDILATNTTQLDAALRIGAVSESVEVTSAAPMLETQSASLATIVDNRSVQNLPMMARNFVGRVPGAASPEPTSTPRVRDYFPETLLWRPEIITSDDGIATAHFRVADNITTWQLSAAASTMEGNTGAGATQFRTFLPFFAAFDPPRILTTGDTIALPVALRNYLDHSLTVRSELAPAPWFRLEGQAFTTTKVPAADSASPIFRFTAVAPVTDAQQKFTARATDNKTGDAIVRPITVHPDGLPTAVSTAGILSPGANLFTLNIPSDMLPGGNDATLKLYPNLAAHLRDALVAMTHYPGGCAEQIISIAWPSLLLQRYAAALPAPNKKLQKETHDNLEQAYENLLSDQRSDGGFAYWSISNMSDPALTAYAIQFLQQAGEFIDVDPNVIKSAVAYLAKQQVAQSKDNSDAGLWLVPVLDAESHPKDRAGNAMLTASIAAMIAGAPDAAPLVARALAATQSFVEEFDEPNTLANYALAALAIKDTARSKPSIERLRSLALTENGGSYWKLETNTPFFGWGRAGRVESTSSALRALLAAGATPHDDLVARGLLFLDHEQDRYGLWYSTQATARVLDVLSAIALTTKATPAHTAPGALTVSIDGARPTSTQLPAANEDAGPIFIPLGSSLTPGTHHLTLTLPEGASATAQIVANLYTKWPSIAPISSTTNNEQLRLAVAFDTTHPAPDATINATAHVERIGFRGYGMLIAEIGLPPGADVDRASLESAVAASGYRFNHYEVLPDRLLVYLWPRAGGFDLHFKFKLRYALDALTAPSIVYDYYNPDAHFDLPPTRFTTQ